MVDAALAGAFAAEQYGLEVLAHDVHDVEGAVTRFVLVEPARAAASARPARTGPRSSPTSGTTTRAPCSRC